MKEMKLSAEFLLSQSDIRPQTALVLGSGLGGISAVMDIHREIPYGVIPGFVTSTAVGHAGKLLLGRIADKDCLVMSGRFHLYEGYTPQQVAYPVYTMAQMGIQNLILTNAAGAVNTEYSPGDLVLIRDHINLMGVTPIDNEYAAHQDRRFVDMTKAYTPSFLSTAHQAAMELGILLREGVYAMFLGPQFETPAEIRMVRSLGGDLVGMSTIPEVIAAAHCGLSALGISCVTNMAAGILRQPITHEEVLETGRMAEEKMMRLIKALIGKI